MWGENGQVNGNGQPMYHGRRVLQPADQPVVDADRMVGQRPCSSITSRRQFYIDLEGSVGELNWSNQGGGCNF